MTDRPVKVPDASHPITVEPTGRRVRAYAGDRLLADTTAALTLEEKGYPPVQYVPRADVDDSALTASGTTTYCPYKGEASYLSVTGDDTLADLGWTYPDVHAALARIGDHVAWDTARVRVVIG